MKKIAILMFATILVASSCKKTQSTTLVVKVPTFELINATAFSTAAGPGSYVDPGVKYTDENGVVSIINTPTSSNVNLAVPGFLLILYLGKTYDLAFFQHQ